jgi:HSP20 family protein
MAFAPIRNIFGAGEEFYPTKQTGSDMSKPFSYMSTMDLVETEDGFKVMADLPGIEPENLNVFLDEFTLGIKANRINPYEQGQIQNPKLYLQDLPYGVIEKYVHLPRNAALDQGKTMYKNGVLNVFFPKIQGLAEPEHKKLSINMA